jgi:hypothetical protein
VGQAGNQELFGEVFALLAVLAASGVIFAAVYLLIATQRVFFGPVHHAENEHLSDLSAREQSVLLPLVAVAILMGVFPQPFLNTINPTAAAMAENFRARAGLPAATPTQPVARTERVKAVPRAERSEAPSVPATSVGVDTQRRLPWRRQVTAPLGKQPPLRSTASPVMPRPVPAQPEVKR